MLATFYLLYVQHPIPTMIAKIIIPIKRGASSSMRNTIMATITIRAIIPIIIDDLSTFDC